MAEGVYYIGLLQRWQNIIAAYKESLKCFLEQSSPICREYERSKQQDQDDSFNVFYLISDLYYRENFHSDIIAFLLDTREKHGYGAESLSVFISLLNSMGSEIKIENYVDAVAVREEGKIDILIKSENSKHVIIIENKINNAGDMPRQLPRYYDYVTELGYRVDAIVYLPLDNNKRPDMNDWSKDDITKVTEKLITVPAYDKTHKNLVNDWLRPLESITSSVDVLSTLRQYSRLIKQLNSNNMDTVILKKFYDSLKNGDNLETAISIRNMINDLPGYLAICILNKFSNRSAPFSKVWIYSSNYVVFEGNISNIYLKISVMCSENGYEVTFEAPKAYNPDINIFQRIISNVDSLKDFSPVADRPTSIVKHFGIFDESGLYGFIDSILKELAGL